MDILFLGIGLLIGALAAWFLAKFKYSAVRLATEEKLNLVQNDNSILKNEFENKGKYIIELNKELSTRIADNKNLAEKLELQKQEIEKIQERFTIEFKNLANEILEEKSKKFTDQNKISLNEILNPLKEKISTFEKKVEDTNKESIERNAALKQQIVGLKELNQQITREAENLTKALKGDTKAQGNWGEFILERILEKSGLTKGREYSIQESFSTEDGNRLQPDVIVNLPDNKHIIIDSKVSLIAYERYVNAAEKEEKEKYLKNHQLSVRSHIKSLSEKNYQSIYGLSGLDFILLFMPVEPAFSLAIQTDEDIFMHAYTKNIVIVSPSTLIATMRTIANIWRQEYQNRNAMEIAQKSGELYDKFVGFLEDLQDIGKKLQSTQKSYDTAMNKLHTGKGNLIRKAKNIKELGASTTKSIPNNIHDKSLE